MENNMIHLSGPQVHVPRNPKDAYRVSKGTILVYIVPWENEQPGRRVLLCEVPEGRVIPAFVYRDMDYHQWRFILAAKDSAELEYLPDSVTSVLLKNFLRRANVSGSEEEGYELSLVEHYQRELLKDQVYIDRGKKSAPQVDRASVGMIKQVFNKQDESALGESPRYRTLAFGCKKAGIKLPDIDRIYAECGKEWTIPQVAAAADFLCRSVVLEPTWYRQDGGVILGNLENEPIVCVPRDSNHYYIYYGNSGRTEKLTKDIAVRIDPKAYTIARSLPSTPMKKKDVIMFAMKGIRTWDLAVFCVLGLIGALIGILLPTLNQKIYDEYIPLGNYSQMIQLCAVIASFMIGNLAFSIVKNLSENRINIHGGAELQNAAYQRVFHLPESFFRDYDSADLAQRLQSIGSIANSYINTFVITTLSSLFSLAYVFRMFKYSAKLSWVAIIMLVVYAAFLFLMSLRSMKFSAQIEEAKGKASGKLYQFLNGVDKIRMAGVEERAVYEYLVPFSQKETAEIHKNYYDSVSESLSTVINTIFTMILYYIMVKNKLNVTMGSFMGFSAAFGTFSGAALQLVGAFLGLKQLNPMYKRIAPMFETSTEDKDGNELVNELKGTVSLEHVTFSYTKDSPAVLRDLSLEIHPGDYIGIVGPSGCGKSTLLKLLLGFENPVTGRVSYDGRDIKSLDKRSLRKNLGVVLQNGRLISGSIYENITITAPHATMKDVERVVEAVGLKDDIAAMPMGLHTVLGENTGTISGGQQQRILIARAIISNPSVLIFDEATSALDNITQAAVSHSLDQMNATRIVVAHRLSTIKNCNRIIVLNGGQIQEEGNYTTLMAKRGMFYELASRQIAEGE